MLDCNLRVDIRLKSLCTTEFKKLCTNCHENCRINGDGQRNKTASDVTMANPHWRLHSIHFRKMTFDLMSLKELCHQLFGAVLFWFALGFFVLVFYSFVLIICFCLYVVCFSCCVVVVVVVCVCVCVGGGGVYILRVCTILQAFYISLCKLVNLTILSFTDFNLKIKISTRLYIVVYLFWFLN